MMRGMVQVERKSFQLGDIVQMKKRHPCGGNEMEVIRMGMDIRIKCVGTQTQCTDSTGQV